MEEATTTSIVVEAAGALERARSYTVTTHEHYEAAGSELVAIKGIAKRMEALRTFLKEPILDAARRIDDLFRDPRMQLEQAEGAIKQAMLGYTREQQRIAAEEAARVRKQLDDQARARAEAEAARVAAERAKAQAAQALADLDGFGPDVSSDDTCPPAVAPTPALVMLMESPPCAAVAVPLPKAKGVSTRTIYRARVVDLPALVKAAAAGDELAMSLLVVNEKLLATLATGRKGALSIPGVEAYEEQTLAAKAG